MTVTKKASLELVALTSMSPTSHCPGCQCQSTAATLKFTGPAPDYLPPKSQPPPYFPGRINHNTASYGYGWLVSYTELHAAFCPDSPVDMDYMDHAINEKWWATDGAKNAHAKYGVVSGSVKFCGFATILLIQISVLAISFLPS